MLEVNETIARKWAMSSKDIQRQAVRLIEQFLSKETPEMASDIVAGYGRPDDQVLQQHFNKVQSRLPEHLMLLDEIGKIASQNGLSQHKLDKLLAADE